MGEYEWLRSAGEVSRRLSLLFLFSFRSLLKRFNTPLLHVLASVWLLSISSFAPEVLSYSVLTHEAIIDSVWDDSLRQLLQQRFPDATPEELDKAHAYAYGGCIAQDMGYYPLSARFFT